MVERAFRERRYYSDVITFIVIFRNYPSVTFGDSSLSEGAYYIGRQDELIFTESAECLMCTVKIVLGDHFKGGVH